MFDANGVMTDLHSKAFLFPTLPAVAALMGSVLLLPAFGHRVQVSPVWSFDALIERAVEFMDIAVKEAAHITTRLAPHLKISLDYELTLAGWSDACHQLESYVLAGHEFGGSLDGGATPTERSKLTEIPEGSANPIPSAEARAAVGLTSSLASFDPQIDGIKLMEAQRLTPAPVGLWKDAPVAHVVGGYVQHTVVTRRGVKSGIIHRWPDKIGERISTGRTKMTTKPATPGFKL